MVVTFKTIHLKKSQIRTEAKPYSPQLSIWKLVGSQGNFRYTLREVITFKSMPLTHFVTGVGSSNLIYALTVVITFRNVLWPKVSSLYFQSWLFWVNLAQVWPKSGPIWSIQKLVRTGIMSVVLWECSWLSKICSDSKSRVSDVKNSRNIFTLFLPQ